MKNISVGHEKRQATHRKVSTIVFLSSILEVLPLFTSISITQGDGPFYRPWIRLYMEPSQLKKPKGPLLARAVEKEETRTTLYWTHHSRGQSRDVKKSKAKLRVPWKSAHQELLNEPSHDIAHRLPQNPLTRWFSWRPQISLAFFYIPRLPSGTMWRSWCDDFHGALSFALHFFTSLDCPLERCEIACNGSAFGRHLFKMEQNLNMHHCTAQVSVSVSVSRDYT